MPWLLDLECDALFALDCDDWPADHRFSSDLLAGYAAVIHACASASARPSARGKRWEIPVPAYPYPYP